MGILKSDALAQQQQTQEHTPLLVAQPAHALALSVNGDASGNEKRLVPADDEELNAQHFASYVHAVCVSCVYSAADLMRHDLPMSCVYSDGKTFASAIISFLGSGVLGFPFAFKQTGILVQYKPTEVEN